MQQLPAFLSETLGSAFASEATLLVLYVLLINIRQSVWSTIMSGECGRNARQACTLEIAGSNPAPGSTATAAKPSPRVEVSE